MANLVDYINWRGDLSFSGVSFNSLDSMVFCQLSYLPLEDLQGLPGSITVRDAIEALEDAGLMRTLTVDGEEKRTQYQSFCDAVKASSRFGSLQVRDIRASFRDSSETKEEIQFAAMTFDLTPDLSCIAYRGTDDTLAGWKEDFRLSYTKVPAQEAALSYFVHAAGNGRHLIITGHSKGGNLALYACRYADEKTLRLVDRIYANDSPGFCRDVFPEGNPDVSGKLTRLIPSCSIVGRLFQPDVTGAVIVSSTASGIAQHGLLTWQMDRTGPVTVSSTDPAGDFIAETMAQWIDGVTPGEREQFVDDVFGALNRSGIRTVSDFEKLGPSGFAQLLAKITGVRGSTVKTAAKLPLSAMFGSSWHRIADRAFWKKAEGSPLVPWILCLALGVLLGVLPAGGITAVMTAVLSLIVILEIAYTVRVLMQSHFDLGAQRPQVLLCIGFIVTFDVLLIKQDALAMLTSILFAVLFLTFAYRSLCRLQEKKRAGKRFPLFDLVLTLVSAGYGGFLLFASAEDVINFDALTGLMLILVSILQIIGRLRTKSSS